MRLLVSGHGIYVVYYTTGLIVCLYIKLHFFNITLFQFFHIQIAKFQIKLDIF